VLKFKRKFRRQRVNGAEDGAISGDAISNGAISSGATSRDAISGGTISSGAISRDAISDGTISGFVYSCNCL